METNFANEFISLDELKERLGINEILIIANNSKGTVFAKTTPEVEGVNILVKQTINLQKPLTVAVFDDGFCIVNANQDFTVLAF